VELRLVREFDAIAEVQAAIAEFCEWEHRGSQLSLSLQIAVRLIPRACDFFDPQSVQLNTGTVPLTGSTAGGFGLHRVRDDVDALESAGRDRTPRITTLMTQEATDVRSPTR
jgi:hypothetical protein